MADSFTSGKKLLCSRSREQDLNLAGDKMQDREGSYMEENILEARLTDHKYLLMEPKVVRRDQMSRGLWLSESRMVHLLHHTGKYWHYMGAETDIGKCLYPEEALYLIDTGELEVESEDLILSQQQAQILFLNDTYHLHQYMLYANLSRSGCKVVRHQPHLVFTRYEKDIRLDQHQKKTRKKLQLDSIASSATQLNQATDKINKKSPTKKIEDDKLMELYAMLGEAAQNPLTKGKDEIKPEIAEESDDKDREGAVSLYDQTRKEYLLKFPDMYQKDDINIDVESPELLPEGCRPLKNNYKITLMGLWYYSRYIDGRPGTIKDDAKRGFDDLRGGGKRAYSPWEEEDSQNMDWHYQEGYSKNKWARYGDEDPSWRNDGQDWRNYMKRRNDGQDWRNNTMQRRNDGMQRRNDGQDRRNNNMQRRNDGQNWRNNTMQRPNDGQDWRSDGQDWRKDTGQNYYGGYQNEQYKIWPQHRESDCVSNWRTGNWQTGNQSERWNYGGGDAGANNRYCGKRKNTGNTNRTGNEPGNWAKNYHGQFDDKKRGYYQHDDRCDDRYEDKNKDIQYEDSKDSSQYNINNFDRWNKKEEQMTLRKTQNRNAQNLNPNATLQSSDLWSGANSQPGTSTVTGYESIGASDVNYKTCPKWKKRVRKQKNQQGKNIYPTALIQITRDIKSWRDYKKVVENKYHKDGPKKPSNSITPIFSNTPITFTSAKGILDACNLNSEVKDNSIYSSVEEHLNIVYDVYLPTTLYKKSRPTQPDKRIVIGRNGSMPNPGQILEVTTRFQDNIPVVCGVVMSGEVRFYTLTPQALPAPPLSL